ncbi:hypothetical protein GF325_04065 [Candidatus Bathyarchaeota archaeon]|nr:hypothetical protein [Candidatus Bathyarchaeota archaeon]
MVLAGKENSARGTWKKGMLNASGDPIITIVGNGGFAPYISGGNGSAGNPYIIRDYVIQGNASACIQIQDTTANFTIMNCTLYEGRNGVLLDNVTYGLITNNTIYGHAGVLPNGAGISLLDSRYVTVFNNTIHFNIDSGVYIDTDSSDNNISTNVIWNHPFNAGVYLHSTSNNVIEENDISFCDHGIRLYSASIDNIVDKNILYNNTEGIRVHSCNNNDITGNDAFNNTQYGYSFVAGLGNNVLFNNASDNFQAEFNFDGVSLHDVINNTVENTGIFGMNFRQSSSNEIHNNSIFGGAVSMQFTLNSINNVLENNTLRNASLVGLQLDGQFNDSVIRGNHIINATQGMNMNDGGKNLFDGNIVEDSVNSSINVVDECADCNFTLNEIKGANNYGFFLENVTSHRLENNTINDTKVGIFLQDDSDMNYLMNNTITHASSAAVKVGTSCDDNQVFDNIIDSLSGDGIKLEHSGEYNHIAHNFINSSLNSAIFILNSNFTNASCNEINSSQYGISMQESSGNTIFQNNLSFIGFRAIECVNCSLNNISWNIASNCADGIYNLDCNETAITNNTFIDNMFMDIYLLGNINATVGSNYLSSNGSVAIFIHNCFQNVNVTNNTVIGHHGGIVMTSSVDMRIDNNVILGCEEGGIWLYPGNDKTVIFNNTIKDIKEDGIIVDTSNKTLIHENHIVNCSYSGINITGQSSDTNISSNIIDGVGLGDSGINFNITGSYANTTVQDNELTDWNLAHILLRNCEDFLIKNNTIVSPGGQFGVFVALSSNVTISWNEIQVGTTGIAVEGCPAIYSINNTISYCSIGISYGSSMQMMGLHEITGNTVFNCSSYGIYLENFENMTIEANEVSNTTSPSNPGVFVNESPNATITGNFIHQNYNHGLRVQDSPSSILFGNEMWENGFNGVYLRNSPGSNLTGNHVYNSISDGIYVTDTSGIRLHDNIVEFTGGNGITIRVSFNCILVNNTVNNNSGSGFNLRNVDNCTIRDSRAFGHVSSVGILITENSNNNSVINNTIYDNQRGIAIHQGSDSNVVSHGNRIYNNSQSGIVVDESRNNLVLNNTILENFWGIRLQDDSVNTTVFQNEVINNHIGIEIRECNETMILENNITGNSLDGINMAILFNITISSNHIEANDGYEIFLVNDALELVLYNNTIINTFGGCIVLNNAVNVSMKNNTINSALNALQMAWVLNSTIMGNNITATSSCMVLDVTCDHANITYNHLSNSAAGMELYCSHANISGNTVSQCLTGVWLRGGANYYLSRNIITGGDTGLSIGNVNGTWVENNTIKEGAVYNVHLSLNTGESVIHNNTIQDGNLGCILIDAGSDYNNITFNLVNGCNQYGIIIDASNGNRITNNTFQDLGYMPAIRVTGNSNNTIIDNNTYYHDGPVLSQPVPYPLSHDGSVLLNWSTKQFATIYYVYRDTNPVTDISGLNPIATTTSLVTEYNDTVFSNGVYFYAIMAGTSIDNSSLSNYASITIGIPLNVPHLHEITPEVSQNGNVSLQWDAVTNATTYYVFRSTSNFTSTAGLQPVASVPGTTYSEVLEMNGDYYYAIVATDGFANSTMSSTQMVTVNIETGRRPGVIAAIVIPIVAGGTLGVLFFLDKKGIMKVFPKKTSQKDGSSKVKKGKRDTTKEESSTSKETPGSGQENEVSNVPEPDESSV